RPREMWHKHFVVLQGVRAFSEVGGLPCWIGTKAANNGRPNSLLCAVASERRRAKWKAKKARADSELQQCGSYLLRRVINSEGIRVVLRSLYADFETAAAQARHTDNHEHPRNRWGQACLFQRMCSGHPTLRPGLILDDRLAVVLPLRPSCPSLSCCVASRTALERPPCHRIQGEINSGAFFRG